MRFAGTSLAVTSPLSDGIALPARVVPTGAPTAGLGRGALSGGGTRGVPGRQEWRGRRQADLRAGGAGGIPPSHPAREDAPYAAATPPLSWVSRRCPASRKRPGASAALFGGEADLANTKARAGCPAHPAARCQSAARCDGRSARAFADARTVPPKNDADWMARCHTVPPRLSIPDFATYLKILRWTAIGKSAILNHIGENGAIWIGGYCPPETGFLFCFVVFRGLDWSHRVGGFLHRKHGGFG